MPLTFPSSPSLNQIYSSGRVKYRWNGESWATIDSYKRQDSPVRNVFFFTASGGETSLSGLDDGGNTLAYNPTFVSVFLNGVRLRKNSDYVANTGSSITGLPVLNPSDGVTIESYDYPYYEQTQERIEYRYSASAGQTSFSGVDANSLSLSYDPGAIDVFVNGVKITHLDYVATTGTSVVLNTPASLNDDVVIITYSAFNPANALLRSGGVMSGQITLPGGGIGNQAITVSETNTLLSDKVSGPASATDNTVVRFDSTTGKLVQASGVSIDDSDNLTGVVSINAQNYGDPTTLKTVDAKYVTDGTAKARLHFDQFNGNIVRDSLNIAAVTDTGTGIYTPAFTANMASANYVVNSVGSIGSTSLVDDYVYDHNANNFMQRYYVWSNANASDVRSGQSSVFGDLA